MSLKFRIQELSRLAGRAFDRIQVDQNSARVRQIPDVRTIRYYTTLGLLDRPSEMKGRTAFYGERHLLQLIAIKREQARGQSLVQIQEQLAGANEKRLLQSAKIPDNFFDDLPDWLEETNAAPNAQPPRVVRNQSAASESALRDESNAASGGTDETASGLSTETRAAAQKANDVEQSSATPREKAFWLQAPATPSESIERSEAHATDPESGTSDMVVQPGAVVKVSHDVSLFLEGVDVSRLDSHALSQLQPALSELLSTLRSIGMSSTE